MNWMNLFRFVTHTEEAEKKYTSQKQRYKPRLPRVKKMQQVTIEGNLENQTSRNAMVAAFEIVVTDQPCGQCDHGRYYPACNKCGGKGCEHCSTQEKHGVVGKALCYKCKGNGSLPDGSMCASCNGTGMHSVPCRNRQCHHGFRTRLKQVSPIKHVRVEPTIIGEMDDESLNALEDWSPSEEPAEAVASA